jgi:TolB-like protein/Flp pilus assembly protein TadD
MATGRRPFAEAHTPSLLIDAILHQMPQPPRELNRHVSPELESIILKALDKQPERRYQSAEELVVDLQRLSIPAALRATPTRRARWHPWLLWPVGALVLLSIALLTWIVGGRHGRWPGFAGLSPPESLAVLPLANLSGDPNQEYFAQGMTEALITDLGKVGAFRVISRTSAAPDKNLDKPISQMVREWKVDAVVAGAVLQSGERVRITARLIDARTERQLWAETYERNLRDVLSLQDDVARAITEAIKGRLTPDTPPPAQRHVDPEAYRLFLQGQYYWNKRNKAGFEKAIDYYQQAIAKDPTDPLPYAAVANGYLHLSGYGLASAHEGLPKARAAALKAIDLDDNSPAAHEAMAEIDLQDWNFSEANREFRRALELDPNFAGAHQSFGIFVAMQGRLDEALIEARQSAQLDPIWFINTVYVGDIYRYMGQPDKAIEQYRQVLEMDPGFWQARGSLAFAYEQKQMYSEAYTELQKVMSEFPHTNALVALGQVYALWGKTADARRVIREVQETSKKEPVSDYWVATIHAALGERDEAFRLLENAYQDHSQWILFLGVDPRFANLRADPRFSDLLRRVGLVQPQRRHGEPEATP